MGRAINTIFRYSEFTINPSKVIAMSNDDDIHRTLGITKFAVCVSSSKSNFNEMMKCGEITLQHHNALWSSVVDWAALSDSELI
eukprot:CAMPEP_0171310332 /NCGR_PEP_ID=MMETSP0816-20121228/20516_1 /TAXON_ID=420281 /ORGANISM="Proboscia inermis, Strain CCAP1064/1" /LENGTH=83 /DNA_ID=CAMNT_0011794395 /DNA_START=91 /DNA_END=342 /DNA_ORIENTATION=+